METRACAVYNLARGILLNSKLTVADCATQPLRILNLLVGGLGLDSESGIWLTPLHMVPGVPRVFPFDLIYLDKDHRVLETAEISPGVEFPPYREEVTSALVVPSNTLSATGTKPGDHLIVCPASELEALLAASASAQIPNQATQGQRKEPGIGQGSQPIPPAQIAAMANRLPRFIPQRVASSTPSASTTTFASSPFPLWHVSSPTGVSPVVNGMSRPTRVANQTNDKRPAVSTGTDNTRQVGVPNVTPPTHAKNPIAAKPPAAKPPSVSSIREQSPKASPKTSAEASVPGVNTFANGQPAELANRMIRESESATSNPVLQRAATLPEVSIPASHGEPSVAASLSPSPKAEQTGRLKTSLQRVESRFKQWWSPSSKANDRRRAQRRYVSGMIAHYFTGGAPKPHSVADISLSGLYLVTEDRWMIGTMIQMTLQRPVARGEQKQSITVLSRIVRRGSDGVAAEFVMPGSIDHQSQNIQPSQATDKFALARFL